MSQHPTLALKNPDGSVKILYSALPHQLAYHESHTIPNVVLGGGRGGGKSYCGRRDAEIRCVALPNFKCLILRKKMPELRETHLKHIQHELAQLNIDPKCYHSTVSTVFFPNGSTIKFGHAEDDAIIETYLSAEYDLIFFDELQHFTLDQFLQISSSARVPEGIGRIALVRGAMNPVGPGAGWIKEWFVDKSVDLTEHQGYNPDDYLYIPSTVHDNPHLDRKYIQNLERNKGPLRKAWLLGEWVLEGAYFSLDSDHFTNEFPHTSPRVDEKGMVHPAPHIYRAMDWGWHDEAVCLWIAVYPNGRAVVIKERSWTHTNVKTVAEDIKRESQGMRVIETFCDPTFFRNSADTSFNSIGDQFESYGIPLTKSINDRTESGHAISQYLYTTLDDGLPSLQIYQRMCPMLSRTLPEMRSDPKNPGKIADHKNDHWCITLGYFAMSRSVAPRIITPKPEINRVAQILSNQSNRRRLGSESTRRR